MSPGTEAGLGIRLWACPDVACYPAEHTVHGRRGEPSNYLIARRTAVVSHTEGAERDVRKHVLGEGLP